MTLRTLLLGVGLSALAFVPPMQAQGSCQVNGWATCTLGGDATHSISVTITGTSHVVFAGGTVSLPNPSNAAYASGFSGSNSVGYLVKANGNWTITISGPDAFWAAVPVSARQDKPVTDLQWATTPSGPFTDVTGTPVTFSSGAPTAGSVLNLHLRSKLSYSLDRPGDYTIPLELIITAP